MTTFERFPSFSVMDDAAMAPSGHFRQDGLTESCVCVSYELQGCQEADCRGTSSATTHLVSVFFENSLKIQPSRKVSWRRAKCSVCNLRRVRVSGDAVGGREFHYAGSQMGSVGFTVPNIKR